MAFRGCIDGKRTYSGTEFTFYRILRNWNTFPKCIIFLLRWTNRIRLLFFQHCHGHYVVNWGQSEVRHLMIFICDCKLDLTQCWIKTPAQNHFKISTNWKEWTILWWSSCHLVFEDYCAVKLALLHIGSAIHVYLHRKVLCKKHMPWIMLSFKMSVFRSIVKKKLYGRFIAFTCLKNKNTKMCPSLNVWFWSLLFRGVCMADGISELWRVGWRPITSSITRW